MKKENYMKLKKQLEIIGQIEDAYTPSLAKGENPLIDGMDYKDAIFEQAGIIVTILEEVLHDEEDNLY